MSLPGEMTRLYGSRLAQQVARLGDAGWFPLVLLWLLCLPALFPLLQPTITQSADGLLHLYRLVALQQAVQQGGLFPRWLPDLAYGYGFPLFVFYAPLAYYLTLALTWSGLSFAGGFNASLSLALLLAGSGVYLLVKDMFGPRAGLLAGVAYVYAPFQLLNSLARGGLPAAWALAAFPFVFWLFRRLIRQRGSPSVLSLALPVSALSLGAALLMHNTLSLLFVPLLGLFLGLELGLLPEEGGLKATRLMRSFTVGLALLLGVGLAAFFLLPAMVEQRFAQVERVIISPDFDFRYHFVSLGELLALPQPANTGLLNPDSPAALGLAQVGLGLLGLAALFYQMWRGKRFPALPALSFTLLGLLGSILLMLALSLPVWESLPLLAFVQFPHRWLGPAALLLAILAGAATVGVSERISFGLTLGGILLIFFTTLPFLYPRYDLSLPAEPTLLDMMAYEHTSGAIGTTSFGEYLPVWVKQIPRESPLEPMYQAGEPVARLDASYLPPGARVEQADYGFNEADLVIESGQPYQVVFHSFYFPGWQVEIEGEAGEVGPVTERGLVGVNLPAGRRHLHLYFGETPVRWWANGLSLVAAGVVLGLLLKPHPRPLPAAGRGEEASHSQASLESERGVNFGQIGVLFSLAILLIAGKLLYFDRVDNPWRQSFDGVKVSTAEVTTQVNFGDQVNLLGYDLVAARVKPGQSFVWRLYWQARQPLQRDYSSLAQLVDGQAHLYAGQDNLHPGSLPARQWQPWGFVQDPHKIKVPYGTPPGDYFLVTGLYQPESWQRLPVVAGGETGWPDVVAVPVQISRAGEVPSLAQLEIAWPVEADFDPQLRLLGASPERDFIQRNDFLRLALFWEAQVAPTANYQVSLRLTGPGGEVALQETNQPSHNRYPTSLWQAGERVRDNQALWIPADFPAGVYRVEVQVLDEAGQAVGEWMELGQLETVE